MDKPIGLLDQIDSLRAKMIKTGLEKGLNNYETIHLSKQLDQLIFTYQYQAFTIKR